MKKFFAIVLVLSVIFSYVIPFYEVSAVDNGEDDNYFIVTAYYSPLPDQEHYLTGNYEDELRLNGRWIAGASGKWVFSGMLAAPSKYRFWTKIYLDGLGIGAVEDRGWAIVPAGQRGYSYDRIDVWVGYGEEGLQRALFWWKRKVYGHVVASENEINLDYNVIPSPSWATKSLLQVKKKLPNIFDISLGNGSKVSLVTKLQELLSDLWHLTVDDNTWIYDKVTIDAVYDFQLKHNIVSKNTDQWAGSYGPKTRAWLKLAYEKYLEEEEKKENFFEKLGILRIDAFSQAEETIKNLEKPVYGEISPRVRELQKTLSKLAYFQYKDTAIFWIKTRNSLIEYQLSNKLISSSSEIWAWIFGPKTRAQFTIDLNNMFFDDLVVSAKLSDEYKKYIIWAQENIVEKEREQEVSIESLSLRI